MNTIQVLGLLALLLSILASLLCAARLKNWRHPILLIGLISFGAIPGVLKMPESQPNARATENITRTEVQQRILDRYRQLKAEHARFASHSP